MSEHNPNEGNHTPPKKSTNPWTIIGWIVVVLIVLPLGSCVAILGLAVAIPQAQEYKERSEIARQAQEEQQQQETDSQETE